MKVTCVTHSVRLCPPSADIVSCVEYDKSGELLATGDRGGRIVIFQREAEVSLCWCFSVVFRYCC